MKWRSRDGTRRKGPPVFPPFSLENPLPSAICPLAPPPPAPTAPAVCCPSSCAPNQHALRAGFKRNFLGTAFQSRSAPQRQPLGRRERGPLERGEGGRERGRGGGRDWGRGGGGAAPFACRLDGGQGPQEQGGVLLEQGEVTDYFSCFDSVTYFFCVSIGKAGALWRFAGLSTSLTRLGTRVREGRGGKEEFNVVASSGR